MRTHTTLTALAISAAAFASGCAATTGHERSEDLAGSIQRTVTAVDACGSSRTAAFVSMDALIAAPHENLSARFETFAADVDRVVSTDGTLRNAVAAMKSSAGARYKSWGQDNASYVDNDMQVQSQRSRAEAAESFRAILHDTDAMLEQSTGFVTYLSDLRRILSNDLSAAGVASVSDFADKARESSARLDKISLPIRTNLGAAADTMTTKTGSN
jgi:hypothetical protein